MRLYLRVMSVALPVGADPLRVGGTGFSGDGELIVALAAGTKTDVDTKARRGKPAAVATSPSSPGAPRGAQPDRVRRRLIGPGGRHAGTGLKSG
jgi:hypothetical protein